jgi:hypothetical protein
VSAGSESRGAAPRRGGICTDSGSARARPSCRRPRVRAGEQRCHRVPAIRCEALAHDRAARRRSRHRRGSLDDPVADDDERTPGSVTRCRSTTAGTPRGCASRVTSRRCACRRGPPSESLEEGHRALAVGSRGPEQIDVERARGVGGGARAALRARAARQKPRASGCASVCPVPPRKIVARFIRSELHERARAPGATPDRVPQSTPCERARSHGRPGTRWSARPRARGRRA